MAVAFWFLPTRVFVQGGNMTTKTRLVGLRFTSKRALYLLTCAVVLGIFLNGPKALSIEEGLPYLDSQFQCISAQQANKFVDDFSIDAASFGGVELCNSQIDTKKLFNDLGIIRDGKFSPSGSNLYIRGFVDGSRYYDWLRSQTRGMDRGNEVPYATAYNSGGYFTMQDGWASSSTLGRVGVLIHEARHTAGYRHIACNQGTYQGSSLSACDSSYGYGGSHAIEMEYYARVSVQGENFHPVYKTMARLMAVARSNFLFNQSPLKKREGLLAVSPASQQGLLFTGGERYEREIPLTEGTLKRTSFGGVLTNGIHAAAIELYERSGFNPLLEDAYSYFKMLVQEPAGVFDLEEYDTGSRRFLVQIDQKNQMAAYNFPAGKWHPLQRIPFAVERTTTTLENGEQGYFLIDQAGAIYPFNARNRSLGSALKDSWNFEYMALARHESDLYVLKTDGHIYKRANQKAEVLWSDPQISYSGLIAVPLYDGFDVKP
jgi:hypothetical protein